MPDDVKEEQEEKRAPKAKPGLKDGKANPVFRILVDRITLVTDRQEYVKGQLVDLSHLPWESIKKKIRQGVYETADGEPANVPAKTYPPCRKC